jgi:hypothetical protein
VWQIIFALWSIPIVAAVFMLLRLWRNAPPLDEREQRLLFGSRSEPHLSIWFGLKLALLAILLFFAGVAQGLILLNFGLPWIVLGPLATTAVVIILLVWTLRTAPRHGRDLPPYSTRH